MSAGSTAVAGAPIGERAFFICHASEDKPEFVLPLARALKEEGCECWVDQENITPGHFIQQRISLGLATCRFFVLCITPHFLRKCVQGSPIQLEMLLAQSGELQTFPLVRGLSNEEILTAIPTLCDVHLYRVSVEDDSLVDPARALLEYAGLQIRSTVKRREIYLRTSYAPYVEWSQETEGWSAAGSGVKPESTFLLEQVAASSRQLYVNVRIRNLSSGYYLSESLDPKKGALCAVTEPGAEASFRLFSNNTDGSVCLQAASGRFVEIEPDTGKELLCAYSPSKEDAAEFHFIPARSRLAASASLDAEQSIALLSFNVKRRFGVRFYWRGCWLAWSAMERPPVDIQSMDAYSGGDSVLVVIRGGERAFGSRVSPAMAAPVGAWVQIGDTSMRCLRAIATKTGEWLLVRSDQDQPVTFARWDGLATTLEWHTGALSSNAASFLVGRTRSGALCFVHRDADQWSAWLSSDEFYTSLKMDLSACACVEGEPAAIAPVGDDGLLLVAASANSGTACSLYFDGRSWSETWAKLPGRLIGTVRLLPIAPESIVALAANERHQAAQPQIWTNHSWQQEKDPLAGIFRSDLAASGYGAGKVYVFGEGLDGAVFAKRRETTGWSRVWSRLKPPPRAVPTNSAARGLSDDTPRSGEQA